MVKRAIGDLAIFYGDRENTGQYDNGIFMDVLRIPFITRIEESSLYSTIIRTMWLDSIGWSKEIRQRYPQVRQIGLSDHPLSTHISRLPAPKQHAYIDDLNYLDGIMALTEEERQWYQVAVPSKPVEYVGLPFPFANYEKEYGHLRNQEKEYIGLGVGAADNDRNFVSNLLVFQKLQLENPNLVGIFLSIPQQLMQQCVYWADNIPNVYIHERKDMAEFYEMLCRCKLILNLADRNTPGRIQGEAAFFGIPVVGSNRLELQNLLWPSYSCSPFSLEEAVAHSQEILSNEKGTKLHATYAFNNLQQFNYESSKKKFEHLLERVK